VFTTDLDEIVEKLSIPLDAVDPRGRSVLKIDPAKVNAPEKGRVVLVTAMTPTPAGEGKTTTSIGLVDGLWRKGVKAVGALREPSLGPLFGRKGGAIGGGQSKVVPADQINMHFTGDLHAVTSTHNLLSAMLDNHLYFGNEPKLNVDDVTWGRVMDMNDRALRKVEVGSATKKGPIRKDRFDITAASEIMAVLCMSKDVEDLQERLSRIILGLSPEGTPITAGDLKATGALAAVLIEATRPNLVRTLEGNPVFVHGGPFANIAQGTSSVMQTRLCRRLADVVVTEAGFAFDLGGFKFLDLKCRNAGFMPAAVVLVATVRALRYHGGADHEAGPNLEAVERGLENLGAHIDAMKRLGLPTPLISINRFPDDSEDELSIVKQTVQKHGAMAVEGDYFGRGGVGAEDLAEALMKKLELDSEDSPDYQNPYALTDSLPAKVEKIAQTVLGASGVELTENARNDLAGIEKMGLSELPVCLAKTHLSISDDKTVMARPEAFTLKVTGFRPAAGAGFVVALCGPVLTMPGLPREPAAYGVGVQQDAKGSWEIFGLR
jgi:formate--tetrahydrofolate ligase